MTSLPTSSRSARTASSSVTPEPGANVILHRASTFPPLPLTIPDRLSVWTVLEVGDSVPPKASMLSSSVRDLHASKMAVSRSLRSSRAFSSPFRDSDEDNAKVSVTDDAPANLSHSLANVTYVGVIYYLPSA